MFDVLIEEDAAVQKWRDDSDIDLRLVLSTSGDDRITQLQ